MAITSELTNENAAPEKAVSAATKNESAMNAQFRAKGQAVRANMSDAEKAAEGSKSDTLEFVHALGNPRKTQSRVENKTALPSIQVCGFTFKTSVDIDVPVYPFLDTASQSPDRVEYTTQTKHIAAGSTFNLNLMETAGLLARVEYAGKATGGSKPVALSSTVSKERNDPLPQLRLIGGTGSVKEGIVEVATKNENGNWVVKPEYEEYKNLFLKKQGGRPGTGARKVSGETTKDIAAAFRAFIAEKSN